MAKRTPKAEANPSAAAAEQTSDASLLIDRKIRELGDWRGETLARMRSLILAADSGIVEELKWMGTPVWSKGGVLCTGEVYKQVVKLTFAQGAKLPDPTGLFNSSLEGNTRRAIDLHEGETIDAEAFQTLVKAAVALNVAKAATPKPAKKKAAPRGETPLEPPTAAKSPVKLLSGGNPQIAKGDGDAPVQAYLDAMPGWKQGVGRRIDRIVSAAVPNVRKAVKWNSPFYGVEGQGWFLSIHCLTKYVKATFFAGASLEPIPPGGTPKSKEPRWLDIYEHDVFDEVRFTAWVKQAAAIPGWTP